MRKQSFALLLLLLMGCFALLVLSSFYIYKTTETSAAAATECTQPVENIKNGEMIWETVSRQFLIAVITK